MRAGFLPLFQVDIGIVVALFFLRITLPRLIGLTVGALFIFLSRIVGRGFFVHWSAHPLFVRKLLSRFALAATVEVDHVCRVAAFDEH